MKENSKAWIITMGGIKDVEMDIASFAGGNVYDWSPWVNYVQSYLRYSYISLVNEPDFLPTSAGIFIIIIIIIFFC